MDAVEHIRISAYQWEADQEIRASGTPAPVGRCRTWYPESLVCRPLMS
jgi:hypothetical protein